MKSMKSRNSKPENIQTFLVCLMLIFICWSFFELNAEDEKSKREPDRINKVSGDPVYKKFNINNISTWIKNDGEADIFPGGSSGFKYPRTSGKTAIFQSGLLWGGKVNGQARVGGSVYRQGTVPGRILNSGVPANQLIGEDPSLDNVRCFRVRPDYLTGSVQAEIDDGEGSDSEIRDAYDRDWMEWPAIDGAPFEDVDSDGFYDPNFDIPGIPGADQTVWFVCNDTDPNQTQFMYGSLPIGIEEQVTVWGYSSAGPLGSTMFKRYIIINKTNTPFEDIYISIWNDPDVGDASDDFVGCDTLLSLTFAYNATANDLMYGNQPPAVGFDLLQGPIVPGNPSDTARYFDRIIIGKKNLTISAHYFYINGDSLWGDPPQGQYQGTLEWYNFMQGKIGSTGEPFYDPTTTNGTTKFALYGDPVASTGWIDGMLHPPGDRRAGLSIGPFNMAPGVTQEIVIATIAAIGTNNLQSISELKLYDLQAQEKYDNFFDIHTGIGNEEYDSPVQYGLHQNYPNPFNPSTKISWQSPVGSWQTLKVFDVLGNEVATLVDDYKPAGSYEFEWDAGELPSGVYFYRIQAAEFVDVKKMIMMK